MVLKSLVRDVFSRNGGSGTELREEVDLKLREEVDQKIREEADRKHREEADKLREEGDQARDEGQWKVAALAYGQYLRQAPGDFAIWVQYGHALKESGSNKAAEDAYKQALALNDCDADLLLNLGHIKKVQGELQAAAEFYSRSFEIDHNEHAEFELSSLDGAVEAASNTEVSGWIRPSLVDYSFFVEVDGRIHDIRPRFYARPDLIADGRSGVGFTAYLPPGSADFELKIGYYGDRSSESKVYLTFIFCKQKSVNIRDTSDGRFVLEANELRDIAAALNPDSTAYHTFVQRYANALIRADQAFDVVFIDGTHGSVSARYRVTHIAEGLQEIGYSTLHARTDHTPFDVLARLNCRIAVFVRTALDQNYEYIAQSLRARGARIVFDIDDLVFDESAIQYHRAAQYLGEDEFRKYLWGVAHYKKFLLYADVVTTSTTYLADYIRDKFSLEPVVVHNTIGRSYLTHYDDSVVSYTRPGARFVVGYYSGTKTHQDDFREAYPGIVRFMRTYPDVMLRVVGYLDLDEFPDLSPMQDRIETIGFTPYYKMIDDIAQCDVVIAPLEQDNPFCEAKSELKFFEAALVGRACIATPTKTFRTASQDGRYCLLAGSETEWFDQLSTLLLSPTRRIDLARAARSYACEAYSYMAAARIAEDAYFTLPATPGQSLTRAKFGRFYNSGNPQALRSKVADDGSGTEAVNDRGLSVGVIVPGIVVGGGGHRKIFKFCADWAAKGCVVTIYVMSTESAEALAKTIRQYFYDFPCKIVNYNGVLRRHDAIVCTSWSTAYSLRNYAEKSRVFYFVQDFEPMFFAAGSEYVKAIGTYRYGFNVVCYGKWVGAKVRSETDIDSVIIPFTMDHSLYTSDARTTKSVDVLFFARPSQDRRCFELGIEALRLVHAENRAIRIALYGEDTYGDLGFQYHNFGLIRDVSTLAAIYRKSRLGICFSTTNPSLVGYEMLASGLPLIDLRVPGFEHNFGGEDFVYYADPTPESIYGAVARGLDDKVEWQRRVQAGLEYAEAIPDDSIIGRMLWETITTKLFHIAESGRVQNTMAAE